VSQRWSEYTRTPLDTYITPPWVVRALIEHLPRWPEFVLEPAAGPGECTVEALRKELPFSEIIGTDITVNAADFLTTPPPVTDIDAIISNPPFRLLDQFIERALDLMGPVAGQVAYLARATADSAQKRRQWFQHPAFATKVTLTERIVWFERTDGQKAAPSEDHCWLIWDWQHVGPPTIAYAPTLQDYRTRHPGRRKKAPQVETSAPPMPFVEGGQHDETRL
jgi:hypothetical protein